MPIQEESRPSKTVHIAKPYYSEEIGKRVTEILRSGRLVQGELVRKFETELSNWIGCKHVVAVSSGTAALHVAMLALKLSDRRKREIITTPLSFAATANAVLHAGCDPVFVDVDRETFNIDPTLVRDKISEKTLAVEPVDVYGLPADLEALKEICRSKGASVVEDAAEAIGATYQGKKVGSISTLSCFSTYATKNLHTGEGGFVTTDDDQLAEKMRIIRHQGQASKYNQVMMGYNFRMLEISAAIGLEQLPHLDELNSRRRDNAIYLKERLESIPGLEFQRLADPRNHAWYMFSLILNERKANMRRDLLVAKLRERGVEADISWPTPIHLQPYYSETFGYKKGDFPNAESICDRVFQLPIHPYLERQDLEIIVTRLKEMIPA